jgi:hypothetical protein
VSSQITTVCRPFRCWQGHRSRYYICTEVSQLCKSYSCSFLFGDLIAQIKNHTSSAVTECSTQATDFRRYREVITSLPCLLASISTDTYNPLAIFTDTHNQSESDSWFKLDLVKHGCKCAIHDLFVSRHTTKYRRARQHSPNGGIDPVLMPLTRQI